MTPTNPLIEMIISQDPEIRNRPFHARCASMSTADLANACEELEAFRRSADNLYDRARATLFLYAAHRFFLIDAKDIPEVGFIPYGGVTDLLYRRFEEAINSFRAALTKDGPNGAVFSALAECYHQLSFQTLTDQVRKSVRASRGNQWMFRVGRAEDHPVRIRRELFDRPKGALLFPIVCERTPVRLDLSHSGWSDIFFLAMDFPEGARALNISVDLCVYGRDADVRSPIETYVRVIGEPLLRLTSVDLESTKDVTDLADLFSFGNDYLSLLKGGIIASGLIPPSFEGTGQPMPGILAQLVGPGMGLELVTKVNDIPKGSRLAVSTNLLASIVSALMRASGQTQNIEGPLQENERRLVVSRAILGEWLGGSGGGWQDSGGVWPGIKVITGAPAQEDDPEKGISNGRLLPRHRVLGIDDLHPDITKRLADSLVLLHGGMAQNVGPILEMVTEKYLLRAEAEWEARLAMRDIFDAILDALKTGDLQKLGKMTNENWEGPLKTVIPWVTNQFTESIIRQARDQFKDDFWGFLMLGGMSGGGMAMFVAPNRRDEFCDAIQTIMTNTKRTLEDALPFAMDPLVYNFRINETGTTAHLLTGDEAVMPGRYHAIQIPELVHNREQEVSYLRRAELDHFTADRSEPEETFTILRTMVSHLFRVADPASHGARIQWDTESENIKASHGFDTVQHEQFRADLRSGRIGLAHNRLPIDTDIQDVNDEDVIRMNGNDRYASLGEEALRGGRVAVLSLGGGVGSRWTSGAGVVKTVSPFVELAGKHRSFLEIHVAKTRSAAERYDAPFPHIVSTSFLTDEPIQKHIALHENYGYDGPLYLSPGRSIGQRLIPMVRDLTFLWDEMPQETLDEQKQKVRDTVRGALKDWANTKGEGADYTDNVPIQRFNPPGHWYEVPNLFRNGVLAKLLKEHPHVQTLMLHNIDTLGADLDPCALGIHLDAQNVLSFEVVPRRIEDRGGGLARVNGKIRLMEGLAQPREEDEFRLRYYNSMTTWIQIDSLLEIFGLSRDDLNGPKNKIAEAVRRVAARMPTYVTIKDVKRRWGHGQEDVYPVAQFEKLWGDMTALPEVACGYIAAPRLRGQQLKDLNQLDPWANGGSKAHIESLGKFT